MHEFSICRNILAAVLEEYKALEPPAERLSRVRVVVGAMHQIVPDYLAHAYDILARDTVVAGSALDLQVQPVTGRCQSCKWEGEIQPPFFQCPSCDALTIEVLKGRELYLDCLEVDCDE